MSKRKHQEDIEDALVPAESEEGEKEGKSEQEQESKKEASAESEQEEASSEEDDEYEYYDCISRESLFEAARESYLFLHGCPRRWRKDREIVMAAVETFGIPLEYASRRLRADKDVVLAAVRARGTALQYASTKLRGDRNVVLEALKNEAAAMYYASDEIKDDREIAMISVRDEYPMLHCLSDRLKQDTEIVMTAIQHAKDNWNVLGSASPKLFGNHDIVLAAVKKNALAIYYASKELRGNREIAMEAVSRNTDLLSFVSKELQEDPEIVGSAIRNEPFPWPRISLRERSKILKRLLRPPALLARLKNLNQGLCRRQHHEPQQRVSFESIESVLEFSKQWKQVMWEKVWLLSQVKLEGDDGDVRCPLYETRFAILGFLGIPSEFKVTRELEECAPLITALAFRELSLDSFLGYIL